MNPSGNIKNDSIYLSKCKHLNLKSFVQFKIHTFDNSCKLCETDFCHGIVLWPPNQRLEQAARFGISECQRCTEQTFAELHIQYLQLQCELFLLLLEPTNYTFKKLITQHFIKDKKEQQNL